MNKFFFNMFEELLNVKIENVACLEFEGNCSNIFKLFM